VLEDHAANTVVVIPVTTGKFGNDFAENLKFTSQTATGAGLRI
jgi:hypothetical protein